MNKEQMEKYVYELMIKNNPEETVKNLLLKDKEIKDLNKAYQEQLAKIPADTCGDLKPSKELLDFFKEGR